MKFTYLIIDLAAVLIPFCFSFHPAIKFHREWRFFFPVLILVAGLFCLWDAVFVQLNVWGFSDRYTLGIRIYNLPLEEFFFFLCIPYACVFTYHCFKVFFKENIGERIYPLPFFAAILLMALAGFLLHNHIYPFVTFELLAITLILFRRKRFMKLFLVTYVVLLLPFFFVNGILTGTGLSEPVVWYNQNEIAGLRLFTIPIEDVFYGMLLVLLNIAGMEELKSRVS